MAGTRVAICVCARCWAARMWRAVHPRTADEDTSCSLQAGLCKMRKKKDETLDESFTRDSTLSAFLLNIDRIDFIPEF